MVRHLRSISIMFFIFYFIIAIIFFVTLSRLTIFILFYYFHFNINEIIKIWVFSESMKVMYQMLKICTIMYNINFSSSFRIKIKEYIFLLIKWYTFLSFRKKKLDLTNFFPCSWIAAICCLSWSSIVFVCFFKAFLREEYVNLAYFISLPWSDGYTSSPLRYSYLSIFPDQNADIFAAFLLIAYCSCSTLILPSIAMISFHIFLKGSFWKVMGYLMDK